MDRWRRSSISRCLGCIDFGFGWALPHVLRYRTSTQLYFSHGWGDLTVVRKSREEFLQRLAESCNPSLQQRPAAQQQQDQKNGNHGSTTKAHHLYSHLISQIQWGTASKLKNVDVRVTEGRFPSPIAHLLPPESKECQFVLVEPTTAAQHQANHHPSSPATPSHDGFSCPDNGKETAQQKQVYVIMLPATGEMGKRDRLNMATTLATRHGWCSIIVTGPYYGARKPQQQQSWFVNTVSDYLLQSQAMMEEAAALTLYCLQLSSSSPAAAPPQQHNNNNTRVCLTGFSWGAAMAGCASCIALLPLAHTTSTSSTRIACVPFVGYSTLGVVTDGLLRHSLDWPALMSSSSSPHHHQQQQHSGGDNCPTTAADDDMLEEAKKKLHSVFQDFNLTELLEMLQKRRQNASQPSTGGGYLGALQVVAMGHDHFIRRPWTEAFIADMNQLVHVPTTTQFPVQWLMGGHVVAALVRSRYHTRAIETAVQALR